MCVLCCLVLVWVCFFFVYSDHDNPVGMLENSKFLGTCCLGVSLHQNFLSSHMVY